MRHIRTILLVCASLAAFGGAAQAQLHGTHEPSERPREPGIRPDSLESVFVGAAEKHHNLEAWNKHEAATFAMTLTLDENQPLHVSATFATEGEAFILAVDGESLLGHDGDETWESPRLKTLGDVEVHVRMLGQLPALPYRLRDERHILTGSPIRMVNERRYYPLTRQPIDGDDWSVLFMEPRTNLLGIVAWFVRTSDDDDPAFSPAFAMVAEDYDEKEGVPFARQWQIWRWSRPRGLVGDESIGTVRVSGLEFTVRCDDTFARPASTSDVDERDDGA